MNYVNVTKLKITNGQIIAIVLFIISLLINLLLAYNEKLNLENQKTLFNNETALIIAIINRILLVLISLYFVYTTLIEKEINNTDNLQLTASILAFIASLIGLYNLLKSYFELKQNANSYDYSI